MPNRGVGKPGIVYVIERMVERVAQELGMDPAEIRRRNFIPPEKFPYLTPSGRVYDSGNYEATLQRALEVFDYKRWREIQREMRKQGRLVGIGLCAYVHGASATAREIEGVRVRIDPTGKVFVDTGSPDMGTSHSTTFAQILAEFIGVRPEDVKVLNFDSERSPWTPYSGTHANKFSGPDVEAMVEAAQKLRAKNTEVGLSKTGSGS